MKIKLNLIKILFCICYTTIIISCSDDLNDTTVKNETSEFNEKSVYLTRTENEVFITYQNFDTENLRRKTGKPVDLYEDYLLLASKKGIAYFGVPDNRGPAKDLNYFDLLDYEWAEYISGLPEGLEHIQVDFYNNGRVLISHQFQKVIGKINNSLNFTVFKLSSKDNTLYLTFYFFDTKKTASEYGENFEKLTREDLYLKTEKKFYYFPDKSTFCIIPCE